MSDLKHDLSIERPLHTPPAGPPRLEPPNPAIYAAMGEEGVTAMLEAVYVQFGQSSIAGMFARSPAGLTAAARKSATFFVTVLGGPPLYHQRYGNPAMRARHTPFVITEEGRREWLRCWDVVLADADRFGFPPEHLPGFRSWLDGFSGWMLNSLEEGATGAHGPFRKAANSTLTLINPEL